MNSVVKDFVDLIGTYVINLCNQVGSFGIFLFKTISTLFTTRLKLRQIIIQMQHIGVESFTIIFLTGISSGFALALQTYVGLSRIGGEDFLGLVVALGITRELGPALTGIMVTARSGSAMAAELGTMQISEQIDAIRTLCINPYQYLIIPRIIASTLILPCLSIISIICGLVGGYINSTSVLELSPETYLTSVYTHMELSDITGGLIKSSCFGFILSCIGSYMGFHTTGGARGVGISTTKSVVFGSIIILIANYFLSSLLFKTGVS